MITDDNPHFGSERVAYDWTEFHTSFGHVIARKMQDSWMRVKVEGPEDLSSLEESLESVRLAFSLSKVGT